MADPYAALGAEPEEDAYGQLGAEAEAESQPASVPAPAAQPPEMPPAARLYNTLRSMGEASGLVPRGVLPDESTARGVAASVLQGPAMNWADETAGLLAKRDAALRYMVEGGQKPNMDQTYREGREAFRNVEGAFREENPAAAFALQTVSGAALGGPVVGSGKGLARYLPALVEGGVGGAGAAAESEDMAEAAAVGAPLAVGGQAFGEVAGDVIGGGASRIGQWAGRRIGAAEDKARDMAAQKVASEIASAKGTLGATTQEANRALENLMRLQQVDALTPDQQFQLAQLRDSGVLSTLHQKLADSMLEQVPSAAGRVDTARAALEGLTAEAPEATERAAEDILSGGEAKRQIMERVKRYAPTIAGSMYGAGPGGIVGYMLSQGEPGGALAGALAGAGARPAFRALERMARHPAVQRMSMAPVRGGSEALEALGRSSVLPRAGVSASLAQRNEVEAPRRGDTSTSDLVTDIATNDPEALGPYAQQLQQAAADGNLPLVHYSLQQKDPNYRALLEQLRTGGTQ